MLPKRVDMCRRPFLAFEDNRPHRGVYWRVHRSAYLRQLARKCRLALAASARALREGPAPVARSDLHHLDDEEVRKRCKDRHGQPAQSRAGSADALQKTVQTDRDQPEGTVQATNHQEDRSELKSCMATSHKLSFGALDPW